MAKPLVAIVGRPNVGKSMLFNKLTGLRGWPLSRIRPELPVTGCTASASGGAERSTWWTQGGIEPRNDNEMLQFMRRQAEIAIETADVIVMVTDVKLWASPPPTPRWQGYCSGRKNR